MNGISLCRCRSYQIKELGYVDGQIRFPNAKKHFLHVSLPGMHPYDNDQTAL